MLEKSKEENKCSLSSVDSELRIIGSKMVILATEKKIRPINCSVELDQDLCQRHRFLK